MNKFSETPTMVEDIAALSWNFFRWALKNFMLHFQRNILRKKFSPKNNVFWSSSDIGQKIFHFFGWTFSTWLSKLHFTCSEDHFENFCYEVDFSFFFGYWAKKFWPFTKKLSVGRSKPEFAYPEDYLNKLKRICFEKIVFHFMGHWSNEIISVFWQNLSDSFAKTAFHLSFSGHLAGSFRYFGWYFAARLSWLPSTYPEDFSS